MQKTWVRPKGQEDPLPCGSAGKESACHVGDLGSIPGLGRSPGEGKGNPLQHRTGKGQFSFQSQRKAMPKNAQTTEQLHSSHTLVKKSSKFSIQSMGLQRGATFISHYNLYQFILRPPLIKSYKAEISRFKQISSLKNTCHISMAVTI